MKVKVKVMPAQIVPNNQVSSFLKLDKYGQYFEAIVTNNADYVESFLSSVKYPRREFLMNTAFRLTTAPCPYLTRVITKKDTAIALPLHLAVTTHSLDVARVLMKLGANMLIVDSDGNNVLHALVTAAFYEPNTMDATVEVLNKFLGSVESGTAKALLLHENNTKFRPIEYAAQQETLPVMQALFKAMPEEFRFAITTHGLTEYTWIDVTDYEMTRLKRSPLTMICFWDKTTAKSMGQAFLDCPCFGQWIRAKFKVNLPLILIWMALRVSFLVTYFVTDRRDYWFEEAMDVHHSGNATTCLETVALSSGTNMLMALFMMSYAVVGIAIDVVELIHSYSAKDYVRMSTLNGCKNLLVQVKFYRICTFLMNASVLAVIVLSAHYDDVSKRPEAIAIVMNICRVFVPVTACWSMMYFLQMAPYVGKSIVAIQGMFSDMANFNIIWLISLVPFLHAFQTFIAFNSRQGCVDDFKDLAATFYTVFRMMINMVDLTQYDVKHEFILHLLHVFYVFMVAIILLNFLIAIMSASATRLDQHRVVIEWLNSLAVAVTLQERFGGWLLKPYYSRMMRKCFATDANGRLFIVSHKSRMKDLHDANEKGDAANDVVKLVPIDTRKY